MIADMVATMAMTTPAITPVETPEPFWCVFVIVMFVLFVV